MKQEQITKAFGKIMVLVPHPDDEILLCAGILQEAVQQELSVQVVMVTNGDYGSSTGETGRIRLLETLKGMKTLGLLEEQVTFLGFADTGMPKEDSFLYRLYEETDEEKVYPSAAGSSTYGLPEKNTFWMEHHGVEAPYTRRAFCENLYEVLMKYRPDSIFTTLDADTHGDHSGLFLFLTEVLGKLRKEEGYEPQVYGGIVHSFAGDDCWPHRSMEIEAYTCPDHFAETCSYDWEERISFPVPENMQEIDRKKNKKYQALSLYETALEPNAVDFLYSFVKKEELFWKIMLERS